MNAGPHAALAEWGWDPGWQAALEAEAAAGASAPPVGSAGASPGAEPLRPARVVRHDGVALAVVTDEGARTLQLRRGVSPPPVVGDWVAWRGSTLQTVLGRRRVLRRRDPRRGTEHVQVANLDLLAVVCGADRPIRAGRLQRFAALAADAEVPVAVVLTKLDLVGDRTGRAGLAAACADGVPGASIVLASARHGDGLGELRALVSGTVVLVGESGAGKSTLVNALVGEEVAATAAVREGDAKGRHTTTARTALRVPGRGVVVDTPGVRAVGVAADGDAASDSFADLDELAGQCRFADCGHDREPGCGVRDAVARGEVAAARRDAWQALRLEARQAAGEGDRRPRGRR